VLFNSLQFLIFFPTVVAVYFALPQRRRWVLLLAASYYFYMSWRPEYVVLILISTAVDYVAGLRMGMLKERRSRRKYLVLSLVSNLGLLFAFKYFNFFSASVQHFFDAISLPVELPVLHVLLPVGISFYTFQTLSYTIDVYRGRIEPERHLGIFAVYVAFFPQLVAGPIERAGNLLPQFFDDHQFDYRAVAAGLKLMLWGYFLKVVIADRAAIVVDQVYGNLDSYTGMPLLVATYLFSFQIYCDFAGYSFIAIGAAKILGFDLMDNFRRPYLSQSVREFWTRWHISLSTWFRDYLYIPLGGNRVTSSRWAFNLMITFLISGLWHGANWTFLVWGALHGTYVLVSHLTADVRQRVAEIMRLSRRPRIHTFLRVIITFHLAGFAWIFFRAPSVSGAWYVVTHMFQGVTRPPYGFSIGGPDNFVLVLLAILFMELVHLYEERGQMRHFLDDKPDLVRWPVYVSITLVILLFGIFEEMQFIYFQF
jgi:D-alanyl-lipoteichoic acid acyltransferase DltB (MBOAT superfamily)